MKQRGVIHLLPLLLIVVVIAAAIFMVAKGLIKLPGFPKVPLGQNQPKVELKSQYSNPFKKETQYVNPFDKYKNPFVVNK